jgi:hypothetical protein
MNQTEKHFNLNQQTIFESDRIIFGDFFFGIDGDNRAYVIIQDH